MRAVAIIALCGCGRINFDPSRIDALTDAPQRRTRSVLTLDRFTPIDPQVEFLLPVILDDVRALRDRIASDASDVRFYDADDKVLAHEIEQVGEKGGPPLVAWVRLPMADFGTTLSVEYGAPPRDTSPIRPWPDNYEAVYHLGTDGWSDSSHGHDGIGIGVTLPTPAPALLGNGARLVAASQQAIELADSVGFGVTDLTVSAFVNIPTAPAGNQAFVSRELGVTDANDFIIALESVSNNFHGGMEGAETSQLFGGLITIGNWRHVAMTADGTNIRLYIDGLLANSAVRTSPIEHSAHPIYIGGDAFTGGVADHDFFDGSIDEVRIDRSARSGARLEADSVAGKDGWITYGPVIEE